MKRKRCFQSWNLPKRGDPEGLSFVAMRLGLGWGTGAAMEMHVQMIHTDHRVRVHAITSQEAYWQFICKIGQAVLWAWASNEISGLISLFFCSIKYKIGLRILKARLSLNLRIHVTCVLSNYSPWPVSLDAQWIWMTTTTIKKKCKYRSHRNTEPRFTENELKGEERPWLEDWVRKDKQSPPLPQGTKV